MGRFRLQLEVDADAAPVIASLLEAHAGVPPRISGDGAKRTIDADYAARPPPGLADALSGWRFMLGTSPVGVRTCGLDGVWHGGWRGLHEPVVVNERLVVVPPWSEVAAPAGGVRVVIDPDGPFGSGAHPTTLAVLEVLVRQGFSDATVLDVGSGSGVLGIFAALHRAKVTGCDLDPGAEASAVRNALRNGVETRTTWTTGALDGMPPAFDFVVANLFPSLLTTLAPDLVARTGKRLIVGGFNRDDVSRVASAFRPLRVVDEGTWDGWVALAFER